MGRAGDPMSGYLPRLRERAEPGPADPLVLDLESDGAGDVLSALSSDTARRIVAALHDRPATLSEVAGAVGTSRQNAQYHLKQLEAVGAVRVIDTLYSEKGREMKVYAPGGEPLIIVSGDDGGTGRLRDAVSRVLAPLAVLGVVSAGVQRIADRWASEPGAAGDTVIATGEAGDLEGESIETFHATSAVMDGEEVELAEPLLVTVVENGHSLLEVYPGLVFFLGAVTALALVGVWAHLR